MPDKYCDLVMKGGVTSGLVFPRAVLKLSDSYGFKRIGGTSAGAIAAVMTAAAEVGRRNGRGEGFEGFKQVTEELTAEGVISGLFQPAPEARGLFDAAKKIVAGRLVAGAISLLLRTGPVAAISIALAALLLVPVGLSALGLLPYVASRPTLWIGLVEAALAILLFGLALAVYLLPGRVARILHGNFFGLCSGRSHEDAQPALLEWMDKWTRRLAGTDGPVVYKNLWNASRYKGEPGGDRLLDLVVYTSNVSYREPHKLPLDGGRFYFNEAEFRRLLPPSLFDWMVTNSAGDALPFGDIVYRPMPRPEDWPIVVAARMSLSFPILLSAIPLYVPTYPKVPKPARPAAGAEADSDPKSLQSAGDPPDRRRKPMGMKPCWFSDGGLTLNFPIHLFDAPLPRWPTFAINLLYPKLKPGEEPPPPRMPQHNWEGWRAIYHPFPDPAPMAQLKSLLGAMVSTVRDWRDVVQVRAPGYRDRIVHVALAEGEGGLNLDMPQCVLTKVAGRGEAAGEVILERFKFQNHYWVRYRNSMAALETYAANLVGVAFDQGLAGGQAWDAMRGDARPPSYSFTGAPQIKLSKDSLDALQALAKLSGEVDLQEKAPRPVGELRVLPKL